MQRFLKEVYGKVRLIDLLKTTAVLPYSVRSTARFGLTNYSAFVMATASTLKQGLVQPEYQKLALGVSVELLARARRGWFVLPDRLRDSCRLFATRELCEQTRTNNDSIRSFVRKCTTG